MAKKKAVKKLVTVKCVNGCGASLLRSDDNSIYCSVCRLQYTANLQPDREKG